MLQNFEGHSLSFLYKHWLLIFYSWAVWPTGLCRFPLLQACLAHPSWPAHENELLLNPKKKCNWHSTYQDSLIWSTLIGIMNFFFFHLERSGLDIFISSPKWLLSRLPRPVWWSVLKSSIPIVLLILFTWRIEGHQAVWNMLDRYSSGLTELSVTWILNFGRYVFLLCTSLQGNQKLCLSVCREFMISFVYHARAASIFLCAPIWVLYSRCLELS